jgi:hypothetical protein
MKTVLREASVGMVATEEREAVGWLFQEIQCTQQELLTEK